MSSTRVPDEIVGCDMELLGSLTALGISADAAHAYGALLNSHTARPAHVATHLGASPARVEEVLEELSEHGMISRHQADVRAVRPSVALPRLLEESDRRLRSAQARLAEARVASTALVDATRADDQQRAVLEVLTGPEETGARISDLLAEAGDEVLTMVTTLPGESSLEHARNADIWLLERGVRTRMLVLAGHVRRSHAYQEHLTLLAAKGAQIRVAGTLPTRMLLIDGVTAVVPDIEDTPERGAVVVRHGSLVRLARDAFEAVWDETRDLTHSDEEAGNDWEPSDLEREVIRLLARGNKDEAVARRVGMSLRSLRRLIAQISQQLDTTSRFELGVRCSARGWV